jgi:mannosyltransferase
MSKKNKIKPVIVPEEPATVKDNLSVVKDYLTTEYIRILIVITAIGAALRFYNLSGNSLWLDEASTYYLSSYDVVKIWSVGFTGDNNPPLFHWITHVMLMFGNSEFILRFLPALMGIAVIPVVYLIGKEFKDENTGLIAAALITFSPFCLNYAQEAYSYSMVLFVSSIMFLLYLIATRTNDTKHWLLFGACSALAFWTHFYTFVPLLIIYAYTLIMIIKSNREWVRGFIYAIITTTILALPVAYMAISRFITLSSHPVTYGVLGMSLIPETVYRFAGFNWTIAGIYIILLVFGLGYLYAHNKKMCLFASMFIVLPIIISVILSSKMTMNPRYLIYLLPIIFVTIASSYNLLAIIVRDKKRLVYVFLIGILVINAIPIQSYYTQLRSEDWRGYSDKLSGITKPGDIVVVIPGYMMQPLDYYYKNTTDGTIEIGASSATELNSIITQKADRNIYFVATGDISAANPEGDAIQWLNTKTRSLGEYTWIYTFVL